MTSDQEIAVNQAAYLRLRDEIDRSYPKDRFVGIHDGRVVADAESFEEIDTKLDEMGFTSPAVLVVRAGDETPEYLEIL